MERPAQLLFAAHFNSIDVESCWGHRVGALAAHNIPLLTPV
jgi:hypothetical protein